MTVLITLTIAGGSSGPFDLYSSNDGFTVPFETNISKSDLISGYESSLVPDYTVTVRVKSKGDCINYTDIPLQHTTTTTTTTTIISANCTDTVTYSSGEAYPTEILVNLGTDTGTTVLTYDAYSIPDRFIVEFDNGIVIDTGYRGDSYYDYGNGGRWTFTGSLIGKIDPITGNTYPDFSTYPDDGYPRIVGIGNGSSSFNKYSNIPTNAIVRVYGPMSGTAWELSVNCPIPSTTTTSSTSNTTTTTTTLQTLGFCYNGVYQQDDPTHPNGGTIKYIDSTGTTITISNIWANDTVTFNASSIVSTNGVTLCTA